MHKRLHLSLLTVICITFVCQFFAKVALYAIDIRQESVVAFGIGLAIVWIGIEIIIRDGDWM